VVISPCFSRVALYPAVTVMEELHDHLKLFSRCLRISQSTNVHNTAKLNKQPES